MNIAVLGSSGFIGQNLLKALPKAQGLSIRNSNWKNELKSVDVIINLVGKAHDHNGKNTEKDYYDVNFELSKEVFENFIKSDAKILIHVSSIAALEEFESIRPLIETDKCHPESWYGKSKRAAEKWMLEQNLPIDKKLFIIRPPMVHGPGDKGNLTLLFKLISKGIPYPLGSFNNKRSFIGIDNFNFFIIKMIEKPQLLATGIYHIADKEVLSTKEIIEIIKNETGKNTITLFIPQNLIKLVARLGDFANFPLNTKRLKKMTNNLELSCNKICEVLHIEKLPFTAKDGLIKTIKSFNDKD